MKKVVVIGGGTGQSTMLRGLKRLDDLEITTIVTVADDGGSTGRLRDSYLIPAVGDIRNVLVALAPEESTFSSLMAYRFEGRDENELSGHSLGNLILLALTELSGSFMEAISNVSDVLNVKGTILPATLQVVTLYAIMEDGTIVRGESNIPKAKNHIHRVFYNDEVHASVQAVQAIADADFIVYGIGSLYTSIMPNLIIPELQEAIKSSSACKIYYSNVMSEIGETDDYSVEMHVNAIENHLGDRIDLVVVAEDEIPPEVVDAYHRQGQEMVYLNSGNHHYQVMMANLLTFENQIIRHDPMKIAASLQTIIERGKHVIHE